MECNSYTNFYVRIWNRSTFLGATRCIILWTFFLLSDIYIISNFLFFIEWKGFLLCLRNRNFAVLTCILVKVEACTYIETAKPKHFLWVQYFSAIVYTCIFVAIKCVCVFAPYYLVRCVGARKWINKFSLQYRKM